MVPAEQNNTVLHVTRRHSQEHNLIGIKLQGANVSTFYVLLTVYLSIFISVIKQLDAQTYVYFLPLHVSRGTAVAQSLRCCATNRKVAGSIPTGVSGFFIDIKSFRSHCGPGVDSACNRNEYQEHFLGVKTVGT